MHEAVDVSVERTEVRPEAGNATGGTGCAGGLEYGRRDVADTFEGKDQGTPVPTARASFGVATIP